MAKLYITEYTRAANHGDIGGLVPMAQIPALTTQVLDITGTSAKSAGFDQACRFVRVHTDVTCHIATGDDPTATTNSMRLAADQTEYFGIRPGQKIAVIAGV